jgi:hypothetical protein
MQQLARFPDYSYNMRRRNLAHKKYETREVVESSVVVVNDDSVRNVEEDFSYFHNFSCDSPPPPPAISKANWFFNYFCVFIYITIFITSRMLHIIIIMKRANIGDEYYLSMKVSHISLPLPAKSLSKS